MLDYNKIYKSYTDKRLTRARILKALFSLHGDLLINVLHKVSTDDTFLEYIYNLNFTTQSGVVEWIHNFEEAQ